ncbi:MAG: hypothetical protein ACON5G_05790 [Pirellulaceae bacterium]
MQIIKILAAFLVIATVGIIGCGEKKAAESGTEGQYANPGEMNTGDMPEEPVEEGEAPAEEAPAEEAPAEEAPAEEAPAEEAPAEGEG